MASRNVLLRSLLRSCARDTPARPTLPPCIPAAVGTVGARFVGRGRTAWAAGNAGPAWTRVRTYSDQASGSKFPGASEPPRKLMTFEEVQRASEDPKSKLVIIDVREKSELEQTGHIPRAINIPITIYPDSFHIPAEEFEARMGFPRPEPDDDVVVYCKAGVRGRAAAEIARAAGWTSVAEYPGSWLDWEKNGGRAEPYKPPR